MSEKADFIVNVLTDWPAIKVGAYVAISAAILSSVGTVAGVYLAARLAIDHFYEKRLITIKEKMYIDMNIALANCLDALTVAVDRLEEKGEGATVNTITAVNNFITLNNIRAENFLYTDGFVYDGIELLLELMIDDNGNDRKTMTLACARLALLKTSCFQKDLKKHARKYLRIND